MRSVIMVLLLLSAPAYAGETYLYTDFQHVSSAPDGPFPSWRPENKETEVNALGIGLRSDFDNRVFLDAKFAWQLDDPFTSELEGADPFFFFRFGVRLKTWRH